MYVKKDRIAEISSTSWNVHDKLKGMSLEDLKAFQKEESLPFAICIINLLGDLNVGIILRNAALMGAEKVFIIGRRSYDKRSTVGAYNYLNIEIINAMVGDEEIDVDVFWDTMQLNHYYPVFIEQGGISLNEADWNNYDLKAGYRGVCLVFGNEGVGISEELLDGADVISIPQLGVIRSFNVSSASSIVMYSLAQHLQNY